MAGALVANDWRTAGHYWRTMRERLLASDWRAGGEQVANKWRTARCTSAPKRQRSQRASADLHASASCSLTSAAAMLLFQTGKHKNAWPVLAGLDAAERFWLHAETERP